MSELTLTLSKYNTLIFDCDGVILDSNGIKTEAFYSAALPWGADAAKIFVTYHMANGGISRQRKFAHFLENILPRLYPSAVPGVDGPGLDELLVRYGKFVRTGLGACPVADGLEALRSLTQNATWCIVSGGDQNELRDVFAARGINHFFDSGIFGSPDSKDTILARELALGNIDKSALFFGDSRYDYEAARRAGVDFAFVSGWTDFINWQSFVSTAEIPSLDSLSQLCTDIVAP